MSIATRLAKLPSAHLKQLAKLTGVNTTATKDTLSKSLEAEIFRPTRNNASLGANSDGRPARILSIDMGIRNLAFCVLEVNAGHQSALKNDMPSLASLQEDGITENIPSILNALTVVAWKRTGLYDLLESTKPISATGEPSSDSSQAESLQLKEAFDPATFASLTYNLVTRVFLPYNVSHVLIERQRHRSGSAPAIMEWTVRVNMLESMLHAVFRTLRMEAGEQNDGTNTTSSSRGIGAHQEQSSAVWSTNWGVPIPVVHSISPRKVGLFWDGVTPAATKEVLQSGRGTALPGRSKGASKVEKEAKIAIASSFLSGEKDRPLTCSAEAQETASAFLAVRTKQMHRRNGSSSSKVSSAAVAHSTAKTFNKKLDDLADCLLQGAAWAQWEWNKSYLREWITQSELPTKKNK